VNGSPTCPVFVQNRYARCGEVIGIDWGSPGIKDWDQCSICGFIQEEGAHLVEATAEGGGVFGHFENGQFVEGYTGVPTAYKSPDTPGVVTLRFKVDDDGNLANDEPTVVEIKITVWDFTITDCPTDWLPEFDKSLDFELEIAPAVDHNGNSLASIINCTLNSSQEPGICNNKLRAEEQFQWDLQFLNPQNDFNVTSSSNEPYKNDKATTKQATTHAKLTVKCYDYGAYGTLTATAYIPNVGMRSARVKGNPGKFVVEIPIDEDNNFIADNWESEKGHQPTEDNETVPQSNQSGDGISRYEEYRGFIIDSGGEEVHIRTDPTIKDVFIKDESNLGAGYFTDLGLKIRWNPLTDDYNLVTRYHSGDKKSEHVDGQYAVRMLEREYDMGTPDPMVVVDNGFILGACGNYPRGDTKMYKSASLNEPDVTTFIYPKRIEWWASFYWNENPEYYKQKYGIDNLEDLVQIGINKVIAHELGHAVNLSHCSQTSCIMVQGLPYKEGIPTSYCPETKNEVKLYKER
jgi:hypothetical protein